MQSLTSSHRPRTQCMHMQASRPRCRRAHGKDNEDSKSTDSNPESDKEPNEQGNNLT